MYINILNFVYQVNALGNPWIPYGIWHWTIPMVSKHKDAGIPPISGNLSGHLNPCCRLLYVMLNTPWDLVGGNPSYAAEFSQSIHVDSSCLAVSPGKVRHHRLGKSNFWVWETGTFETPPSAGHIPQRARPKMGHPRIQSRIIRLLIEISY